MAMSIRAYKVQIKICAFFFGYFKNNDIIETRLILYDITYRSIERNQSNELMFL